MTNLAEHYLLGWHAPDPLTMCTHHKKVGHRVDAGVPDVPTVVFVLGATCLLSPFLRPAPGTHGSQPNPPASVSVLTASFRDISWWTHAAGAGRRPPQQPVPRLPVFLLLETLWSFLFSSGSLGMVFGSSHFPHETISFLWSTVGFGAYLKINLQGI